MSHIGRKVTMFRMHTPSFIPGFGNLKDTVTQDVLGSLGTLEVTRIDGGVLMEGKAKDGKRVEAFVPDTNIQIMTFEPAARMVTKK